MKTGPQSTEHHDSGSLFRICSEFDRIDSRILAPDPGLMNAIGGSHTLKTALADLVDNAIDARANRVLILFVRREDRMRSLLVVDNGCGMDDAVIDKAMTLGYRRAYETGALGHFGMGLKAASFSQASTLTLLSTTANAQPAGRRWQKKNAHNFSCDTLDPNQVRTELLRILSLISATNGTIVRWDDLLAPPFPARATTEAHSLFLEETIPAIRIHLGIVFHRFLDGGQFRIDIGVADAERPELPSLRGVPAVDPFAYGSKSGATGYPKSLQVEIGASRQAIHCHIWPMRRTSPNFFLDQPKGRDTAGLYFYRNRRLLRWGGWFGLVAANPLRHSHARVQIDIEAFPDIMVNMEKNTIQFGPEVAEAIVSARGKGTSSFQGFLEDAASAQLAGNRRQTHREPVLQPGKGIAGAVREAIGTEFGFDAGRDLLNIRWKRLKGSKFLQVDREKCTLYLNDRFRNTLLAGRNAGLNDVPVIKALIFLLTQSTFQALAYGPRLKDNVEAWNRILWAAAVEEVDD
jgi:hypothetical protein